jgi:hypothetical protein
VIIDFTKQNVIEFAVNSQTPMAKAAQLTADDEITIEN